jgi:hypothetical protein
LVRGGHGAEVQGGFPEAGIGCEIRAEFARPKLRLFSDYRRTLENWSAFYPPERIFVGFLEDVGFFPDEMLRALYAFLEVDPSTTYRVIKRKIHSGAGSTMGTKWASYLAGVYRGICSIWTSALGVTPRSGPTVRSGLPGICPVRRPSRTRSGNPICGGVGGSGPNLPAKRAPLLVSERLADLIQ